MTKFLINYLLTRDPNLRIMHIMNNATDAEQFLRSVQRSLTEPGSLLVQEHGPYKSDNWKATEFNVAKRTINDKDPSFAAYGTGSNVFGHRSDLVIADDILTLENSGPQVTDAMRQKTEDWFFQGVMNVAAPYGKVVVIGTAMDHRDLYHKLAEPQHGFTVIKHRAILDDESQEVLWPERFTYEWLSDKRSADYTSFMKRYQNVALDDKDQRFKENALLLCRDMSRGWGQVSQEMKDSGHTHVLVAFDPSAAKVGSRQRGAKWAGVCVAAFNPSEPDPKTYHVLEIWHVRDLPEKLVELLGSLYKHYSARGIVVESNGLNVWFNTVKEMRDLKGWAKVIEFATTGDKKIDPDTGIDTSLVAPVQAAKIRFPYGDKHARQQVDEFFTEEMIPYPQAYLSDRLMALWFFVHTARSMSSRRTGHFFHPVPPWARGAGLRVPLREPRPVINVG